MIRKFKKFTTTDLFKTSILNGIANIIKILTGLISNKIVAVYLGPAGIALLGQFHNFFSLVTAIGSLGINQGLTKYVSEYSDNPLRQKKVLSTGFYIVLLNSLIISIFIIFGRNYFSQNILHNIKYSSVFLAFSLTLMLFVLNAYFVAVLNGFKEFKKIITTNIISSLFGLIVAIFLTIKFGVIGALLGYILSQTLVFFITINWVLRSSWFSLGIITKYFDKSIIKDLGRYTLMAITTMLASTFVQLQLRTFIINNVSIADAGYWQGIIRICDLYLMFITTTFGVYFLPKFSELKENNLIRNEVIKGYKFIIPIVLLSSAAIFFTRDLIIQILYSNSFFLMKDLFLFQLLGNIFRISSWLLSYLMLAKAMTKTYIVAEISFGLTYYLLTIYFLKTFGIIGATYSYCISYFLYLAYMVVIFKKVLFNK